MSRRMGRRRWPSEVIYQLTAVGLATVVACPAGGCQVGVSRPSGEPATATTPAAKRQRVASLSIGTDEILCALVPPERIVALSKYAADPEVSYVADVARQVGVFVEREPERMLSLRADLVLLARYTRAELRQAVEQTGTPTLLVEDFRSLDDIENNVRRIGRALGEEARAETVIAAMHARLKEARAALRPDRVGWRVLYVMPPLMVAGRDTMTHVKLTSAGLQNAASDVVGHTAISAEALLKLNPDVILVATGFASDVGFRERLLSDPQLVALEAVRRKRVLALPSRSLRTVSHHTADAVMTIVEAVNALP